ncbi:MAG: hypothetical protein GYA21_02285 [Myxococcales bacterium]|nr:hypothetical protein [Myxococcales bacterium]
MGLFGKGQEKMLARQKESILDEAQKAGVTVEDVFEIHPDDASRGKLIGDTLKSLLGGRLRADAILVFKLRTGELTRAYFQPFATITALPGEHHALLRGCLKNPVALQRGFFGGLKWFAGEDRELSKRLAKERDLKKAAKKLKWEWPVGASVAKLDWTVQAKASGQGNTHLVLKAGRYGGFTAYKVGLAQFGRLCETMLPLLQEASGGFEQNFIFEPAYAGLFLKLPGKNGALG